MNKMDPPPCIQNAMMTKDKKPFTYTPGGIDLSEVRSPRMARRIERNAHLGGVDDTPKPHQTCTNYATLPPSTLAAMRPQPQVQVFPSGPPPPAPFKGGMPPPPPPPSNMPPPPPPSSDPLPTQKIRTSDNQTLERPDMTKIIPENPMALLRKTGGPAPRKSVVDEIFEKTEKYVPTPPATSSSYDGQQRYPQQGNERGSPVPQQQNQLQSSPPLPPPQPKYISPKQIHSFENEEVKYQPPVVERKPMQNTNNEPTGTKVQSSHPGQLYIPPSNQHQQKRIVTPPSPPERSPNSPQLQTPPLREAPRPWQTKKPQQEELPPWTKKGNEEENYDQINPQNPPQQQPPQSRWPQSKPLQQTATPEHQQSQYTPPPQYQPQPHYNQQPIGVRIEIRTNPQPYGDAVPEEKKPDAVYVTQPLVFQHPGPRPALNQQKQAVNNQGVRVIPVQVEGSDPSPPTPRSLNRQQSWGTNPTQSNSFKIIQKITQTDDNEYDDTPVTQHSARFPQNFQQPMEQIRRMKVQDNDQPRYGQGSGRPQSENRQPHVRTIPIQLEDDSPSQQYVHPSEQVVPEPKKYTGSAIPSRSFKILQAMTAAPDNCASVDEQNEASLYDQWAYPPYPFPPYWPDYYHNYYYSDPKDELSDGSEQNDDNKKKPIPRVTPVPFWEYGHPYCKPKMKKTPSEECYDSSSSSRSTPLPFHNAEYYYTSENESSDNGKQPAFYPYYPYPYYDPYYYHYYHGYLPMYPPMYYYEMPNEESNDYHPVHGSELNQQRISLKKTDSGNRDITSNVDSDESRSSVVMSSSMDNERDDKETRIPISKLPSIKSIKSVKDLKIFETEEKLINEHDIEECSDYTSEESEEETSVYAEEEEDEYPHQLSVIMEESERTESRLRSPSVASDTSTLSGKTGVEDDEPNLATLTLPLRNKTSGAEDQVKENFEKSKTEDIIASYVVLYPHNNTLSENQFETDQTTIENEDDCVIREDILRLRETYKENDDINTTNVLDEENDKDSDGSEDWWGIIGKDEDDFPRPKINIISYDNTVTTEDVEETNNQELKNNSLDITHTEPRELKFDTTEINKRISVYDLNAGEDEPEEEIMEEGKLLEMESFVEQLEQLKLNSGLWKIAKANSRSKVNCTTDNTVKAIKKEHSKIEDYTYPEEPKQLNNTPIHSYEEKTGSADYTQYNYSMSSDVISTDYSFPSHSSSIKHEEIETDNDDTSDSETSSSDDDLPQDVYRSRNACNTSDQEVKMLSVKERIAALKESIRQKQNKITDLEIKVSVKHKLATFETFNQSQSKTTSTKSSIKSFEEYSEEEEVDSGVTSDMSRHISDNEEFPELKKLTRYQRAATHSRLFKLLQEECEDDEHSGDDDDRTSSQPGTCRRDLLSLPLNKFSESESSFSSGKSSPNVGVNEKLVSELVQSLLKRKKGQAFKDLPKEKLYAAAVKVLQEEIDISETPSEYSSFLSRNGTGYSTAAQTPQEFNNIYDEYKQYYDSWSEADRERNTDTNAALYGKGLKTVSSKQIQKKIMKLLGSPESLSLSYSKPLDSNEVTTAS